MEQTFLTTNKILHTTIYYWDLMHLTRNILSSIQTMTLAANIVLTMLSWDQEKVMKGPVERISQFPGVSRPKRKNTRLG